VSFNRGDAQDAMTSTTGARTALSLGGGIRYEDVALERVSSSLVVHLGAGDKLTLNGWYQDAALQVVDRVQFIAESMAAFSPGGTDPLRDQSVELFDFRDIVDRYDAARAGGFKGQWLAMGALLDAHLGGSDGDALGGDLAYRYGIGGLQGVALSAAQAALGEAAFGADVQALRPLDGPGSDPVSLSG
jgi:hypothetical protein